MAFNDESFEDVRFDIEDMIEQQLGMGVMPFDTLDRFCIKGRYCFYRHPNPRAEIVCKHWLRGLCKKNDDCEFLHELNVDRMPDCYFFLKYGKCANKECSFKHPHADDNTNQRSTAEAVGEQSPLPSYSQNGEHSRITHWRRRGIYRQKHL